MTNTAKNEILNRVIDITPSSVRAMLTDLDDETLARLTQIGDIAARELVKRLTHLPTLEDIVAKNPLAQATHEHGLVVSRNGVFDPNSVFAAYTHRQLPANDGNIMTSPTRPVFLFRHRGQDFNQSLKSLSLSHSLYTPKDNLPLLLMGEVSRSEIFPSSISPSFLVLEFTSLQAAPSPAFASKSPPIEPLTTSIFFPSGLRQQLMEIISNPSFTARRVVEIYNIVFNPKADCEQYDQGYLDHNRLTVAYMSHTSHLALRLKPNTTIK